MLNILQWMKRQLLQFCRWDEKVGDNAENVTAFEFLAKHHTMWPVDSTHSISLRPHRERRD
jgi:hypothetical protein